MIEVGNAPCSWGTIEGFESNAIPYDQMLDELQAAGFAGTELGDLGYLPTDPHRLRQELTNRGLAMLGAYEGVELRRPGAVAAARDRVLSIAELLAATVDLGSRPPYFILADENNADPLRTRHAGRITPDMSLSPQNWDRFTENAIEIAQLVQGESGIRTLFHPHCAAFVERPDEIERFLERIDSGVIDLVFDTGHYTYGAGEPDDGHIALRGLERFWDRVAYVHFKDCDPQVAREARRRGWDYPTAVGNGIFCELGQGSVDFPAIVSFLRAVAYDDWITVEQDVLPGMGTPKESAERNRAYLRALGL